MSLNSLVVLPLAGETFDRRPTLFSSLYNTPHIQRLAVSGKAKKRQRSIAAQAQNPITFGLFSLSSLLTFRGNLQRSHKMGCKAEQPLRERWYLGIGAHEGSSEVIASQSTCNDKYNHAGR